MTYKFIIRILTTLIYISASLSLRVKKHKHDFFSVRVPRIFTQKGRELRILWPTMRNATHFILGQCVALRIKNWRYTLSGSSWKSADYWTEACRL